MTNVTKIDHDLTNKPLRIIEHEGGVTIVKNGGDYPAVRYTQEEIDYWFEWEMMRRMPFEPEAG